MLSVEERLSVECLLSIESRGGEWLECWLLKDERRDDERSILEVTEPQRQVVLRSRFSVGCG